MAQIVKKKKKEKIKKERKRREKSLPVLQETKV